MPKKRDKKSLNVLYLAKKQKESEKCTNGKPTINCITCNFLVEGPFKGIECGQNRSKVLNKYGQGGMLRCEILAKICKYAKDRDIKLLARIHRPSIINPYLSGEDSRPLEKILSMETDVLQSILAVDEKGQDRQAVPESPAIIAADETGCDGTGMIVPMVNTPWIDQPDEPEDESEPDAPEIDEA